jgi:hypothetical protein
MEGLSPLHRPVAGIGIDVHRMLHVNAHFIKHVPGRKTDMLDSQWLAVLARFGLVRASFIPARDRRELRLVARYRRNSSAMCSGQINRLHKILDDAGIKLGALVADIHGVSARAMVRGLIAGHPAAVLLSHARGALERRREELAASLECDLSARHLFVLRHLADSIDALQRQLADIDAYLMAAMQPYAWAHRLLQTIPNIDAAHGAGEAVFSRLIRRLCGCNSRKATGARAKAEAALQ